MILQDFTHDMVKRTCNMLLGCGMGLFRSDRGLENLIRQIERFK
jgi:hypothetical protein